MRRPRTSFGERDRFGRRPVGETREIVAEGSAAGERDGVGDQDGVGGSARRAGAAREPDGRGREVECPLQSEASAAVHDVVIVAIAHPHQAHINDLR